MTTSWLTVTQSHTFGTDVPEMLVVVGRVVGGIVVSDISTDVPGKH